MDVLLEEWSPVCSIQAVVEDNGQAVYFYLWVNPGSENAEIRNCWICNRVPAMEDMDYEAMKMGMAPRMPRAYVTHDSAGICLDREKLSLVWFEEGDGAALYEDGRMIAVIPGWAGREFPGYSLYAKGMAPFAWELQEALPVLEQRMERSRMYWDIMEGGYFETMQQEQLAAMEAFFGPHKKYYAIDGGGFPPKALVTGERKGSQYAFTLGNGALAQPKVEQYFQDETWKYRRMELGVAFPQGCSQEGIMAMLNYTAAQASLPWKELSWLGHGHTIPCSGVEGYEGVLLLSPALCGVQEGPAYPMFMDEPVNLLWMMLLTGEEYELVKEQGTDPILEKKGADPAAWNLV